MTVDNLKLNIKKWYNTFIIHKIGGDGGMVDATDLKSGDFYGREGSSPSIPKNKEVRFN